MKYLYYIFEFIIGEGILCIVIHVSSSQGLSMPMKHITYATFITFNPKKKKKTFITLYDRDKFAQNFHIIE